MARTPWLTPPLLALTLVGCLGPERLVPLPDFPIGDAGITLPEMPSLVLAEEPPPAPRYTVVGLPRCPRPYWAELELKAMRLAWRNSGEYRKPSVRKREGLQASMIAFAQGDNAAAVAEAEAIRYSVCADGKVVLWRPIDGTGQARLVWRVEEAAPLVVEIPHPVTDLNTLAQGVTVFRRTRARALVVSGTHRCADRRVSGCPGFSGVCSRRRKGREPYRLSDMAHTPESTFHAAHEVLAEIQDEVVFVSLHGMNQPGVVVSDGTDLEVGEEAPAARVARILARTFPGVRTCNGADGVRPAAGLCGMSNVQGLQLNGAPSCHGFATGTSGRFVHLEQSRTLRRRPRFLSKVLLEALGPPTGQ